MKSLRELMGDLEPRMDADAHSPRQPAPVPNELPAVWDLVIKDFCERDKAGRRKYGVPLQPLNGRDALVDAYEEAMDLCVYLRQAIEERRIYERARVTP